MNANRRFLIAASLPLCLCAAVYAAVSCAALAMSVWLYIVRCAVMCDIDCRRTCPAPFLMLAAHMATADTAL